MKIISFDTETYRIGPKQLAPKVVCATFAMRAGEEIKTRLVGNHPDDKMFTVVQGMLTDPDTKVVTHSGGFDWACMMFSYPDLIPVIFDALLSGRATDTLWREKLLNLSTTGRLTELFLPNGQTSRILYSLAALDMHYLGKDRTAEKEDLEESWRANYSALDGWKAEEYPEDAAKYALEDAVDTLLIYEAQEQRKSEWVMASTATEEFRLAAHLSLYLMSHHGMLVNKEVVEQMAVKVKERVSESERSLIEAGIIQAAQPAQPYLKQREKAASLIEDHLGPANFAAYFGGDFEEFRDLLEQQGIKFLKAKPSKVNMKRLQEHVAGVYKRLGELPNMTAGGAREPQIQIDNEVQEHLAEHDELMRAYRDRQELSKLATQQIPMLLGNDVVHPNYDVLKETGRTSSYGNPKGKPGLYPAVHIQGIPGEIGGLDPRQCYKPRPGRVYFDVDYTALELAGVGQVTYELFGRSVHLERYNQGVDLHGYLGAQLVVMSATDGIGAEFTQGCRSEGLLSDPLAVYEAFMLCKKHEDKSIRDWWKKSRNFAKPVGLGFPGGLGPATMVEFARKTYNVILTEKQAYEFRDMWREVYPEMPRFFDWVNGQTDPYNDGGYDENGRRSKLYWYETPLGMIRRGASFCAAANGKSMQSPGAEGAIAAMIRLTRACYDPTLESILYGCRPIAFIHDQVIGETTEDESLWHDQCMEVRRIMCESMQLVLPDIKMRSDEAHLTSVWSKSSVPTFDESGRLIPWRPKQESNK